MNKFRILIVEDNFPFAINLENHLVNWGHEVLKIIDNGNEALAFIQEYQPELVLMDINIKGDFNGIEVAKAAESLEVYFIFMTIEKNELVFESLNRKRIISYLVKPFDPLSLKGAIHFAASQSIQKSNRKKEEDQKKNLFYRQGKHLQQIETDKLLWIKADRNYCDIYTTGGRLTIRTSLRKIMDSLPKTDFFKIHKGYIVSLNAIEQIFLSDLKVIIQETEIPIGRSYKKEFMDRIETI